MRNIICTIILLLSMVGVSEAQVTAGTVFSKTEDGNGNKITSTVSGPDRGINVYCIGSSCTGAGGSTYLDADAIVNQTTTAVHGQSYFYNGATWDRMRGDTTNGLWVNCKTGCAAGGSSTPTDAFANPTTAGLQQDFLMGYNGATWDRLRSTIAGGLLVDVSDAFLLDATVTNRLPAGSTPADNESNAITATRLGNFNFIYDGATWDRWTGAVTQGGFWQVTVTGLKTNNAGVPGANNLGVLPCVANAAAPVYIETSQVLCSTNLSGATRTIEQNFATAYVDADTIANQTTTAVHGQLYGYNGATWDRLRSTIAGGLLVDVSDAFVLDATLTNRFPVAANPADNETNAANISRVGNYNFVFDGAAWDRWTGAVTQSGTWNIGTVTTVTSATISNAFLLDATFTGRFPAAFSSADNIAAQTSTFVHGGLMAWDATGLNWDRVQIAGTGAIATSLSYINGQAYQPAQSGLNSNGTGVASAGIIGLCDDTSPTAITENQFGMIRMNCTTHALFTEEKNQVTTSNSDGSCPSGAASFTVIASNASRTWLAVWASPANTDDVYIKLAATATTADARFAPGQALNFTSGRIYTGIIDAIPASGTQAVCVMELN